MTPIERWFYYRFCRGMYWLLDFGTVIARSTHRNPAQVDQLGRERDEYALEIFWMEH